MLRERPGRRLLLIVKAEELMLAKARLARARRGKDADLIRRRAEVVMALSREVSRLGGPSALDPRGERPAVEIAGRSLSGGTGRVDRPAYGHPARGQALHKIKSLKAAHIEVATAYGALAEVAAWSGGGGPQMAERVDRTTTDGAARMQMALEASRMVARAEAAALCQADLVARYGAKAAPEGLRDLVMAFLSDTSSGPRRPINRVALLRGVVLWNMTLTEVLEGAGWKANDRSRKALADALADTLDVVAHEWGGDAARLIGRQDVLVRAIAS